MHLPIMFRLSVLGNVCFILCLLLRHGWLVVAGAYGDYIIVLGWVLSLVFNFVWIVSALLTKQYKSIPTWFLLTNGVISFIEIGYFCWAYIVNPSFHSV